MKKFLIMAGGTGGHVFPALAVAEELKKLGAKIEWLGTRKGIEADLVPPTQIPLHFLSVTGLRGKGFLSLLSAPFRLSKALIQALKIMRQIKPDAVIGFGGFASGPGALAAWLTRTPLFIHEQNAIAGLTNRLLAPLAKQVFATFPDTFKRKNQVVGNPIRASIATLPTPEQRFADRTGSLRLLILGGSAGALAINNVAPKAFALLAAHDQFEVWHQAGKKNIDAVRQEYAALKLTAKLDSFIEDMAQAYAWADIVLCRSGATTVTELMAAGVGSILIPYPHAVDDHQFHNANHLARAGAGIVIRQNEFNEQQLAGLLQAIQKLGRPHLLAQAKAAHALAQLDAAAVIAKTCFNYK